MGINSKYSIEVSYECGELAIQTGGMDAKRSPSWAGRRSFYFLSLTVGVSVLLLGLSEDYDTVPVVDVVGLDVATVSFENQTVGIDAVLVDEYISNSLSATF